MQVPSVVVTLVTSLSVEELRSTVVSSWLTGDPVYLETQLADASCVPVQKRRRLHLQIRFD